MRPSLCMLFLLFFFVSYSQALRPEFGPIRISLPYILAVLGLLFLLLEQSLNRVPTQGWGIRLHLPALVFLLVYTIVGALAIVKIQTSLSPYASDSLFRIIEQLGRLVLGFIMMIFVGNKIKEGLARQAIAIMSLSAGLVGAYGIYQVLGTYGGFYRPLLPNTGTYGVAPGAEGASRAIGMMQEPSYLAGFLCFSIIMTTMLLISVARFSPGIRLMLWVSVALQGICMLMTASTGGFAALLAGVVAGLVILKRRSRGRLVYIGILTAMLLAVPTAYVISHPNIQRHLVVGTIGKAYHVSAAERTTFIKAGLDMFYDHPFIGVGPSLYDVHVSDYTSDFRSSRTLIANNIYVELLAETGLIGFIVFMALFVSVYWRAVNKWRDSGHTDVLSAGLMIACISLAVQFMAYPTFKMEFIWLLFGLAVAPSCLSKTSEPAWEKSCD